MAIEVIMPKQGNTVESCLILEWRVQKGSRLNKGDVICTVETDKASVEVEAEQEGMVLALLYKEGDDVPVLQPILILGEDGEDISALLSRPDAAAAAPAPAAPVSTPAPEKEIQQPHASPRGRRAAEQHGLDLGQLRGSGPGGRILEEDVLRFVEQRGGISPAARDALQEHSQTLPGEEADSAGQLPPGSARESGLSGIRKIIAQKMMESLQGSAQYTLHSSASAVSIQKWRKTYKESDEALGLRGINIGDMVFYALARTLPRHPHLNAEFKNGKIYSHSDVHIGFAVDTPRGLMVPVLKNADRKSLRQISQELKQLAGACLEGSIQPEALSGATFTVSNLGPYGIEHFTPVINPPQVAILGICSITMQPIEQDGQIIFEPRMGLSMTIDHQIVDGAPAARFLSDYARLLSQFELIAAL